ncbi:PIN domain-containing protein [Candidatus Acetothermia bacterium]|nr:PIN domain-containing protein [Candidatus Acetothermia bacterium]MCI2432497.1 PIN domain-containing protein [Candidatus Acetothermia bacterium]MCI2437297.1 PIN domain-containing protein [Candidatus Acetothermia bacterium]
MGQLSTTLLGERIALDTAVFIYALEAHPIFGAEVQGLLHEIDTGQIHALTSVLTLLEVLVQPLRHKRMDLVIAYRERLTSSRLKLYPLTETICEKAAELRARYTTLQTPDAIQLATALFHNANFFITNDDRLRSLEEIPVVVLKDCIISP